MIEVIRPCSPKSIPRLLGAGVALYLLSYVVGQSSSTVAGHEHSYDAALGGALAAEHRRFWEYADTLFGLGHTLSAGDISRALEALGLAPDPSSASAKRRVDTDVALARRLGIELTPTFLILVPDAPPIPATSADIGMKMIQPRIQRHLGLGD